MGILLNFVVLSHPFRNNKIIVERRYIFHSTNECYVHIRVDVVGGSCRFIF